MEELLEHLVEEAAEIVQACTKLRRFGPEGRDPRPQSTAPTNRKALALEFGQLVCVVDCLIALDPRYFRDEDCREGWERKASRLQKYLKRSRLGIVDGEVKVEEMREQQASSEESGQRTAGGGSGQRTAGGGSGQRTADSSGSEPSYLDLEPGTPESARLP